MVLTGVLATMWHLPSNIINYAKLYMSVSLSYQLMPVQMLMINNKL